MFEKLIKSMKTAMSSQVFSLSEITWDTYFGHNWSRKLKICLFYSCFGYPSPLNFLLSQAVLHLAAKLLKIVSLSTENTMPKQSDHGICIIQLSYILARKAFLLIFIDPLKVLTNVLHLYLQRAVLNCSDWLKWFLTNSTNLKLD